MFAARRPQRAHNDTKHTIGPNTYGPPDSSAKPSTTTKDVGLVPWRLGDQPLDDCIRYSLLPHKQYNEAAVQRFGIERSQPLVAVPARGPAPSGRPFLEIDTPDVIVASMKPKRGRPGVDRTSVRSWRPTGEDQFPLGADQTAENMDQQSGGRTARRPNRCCRCSAHGLVTLRAELPNDSTIWKKRKKKSAS